MIEKPQSFRTIVPTCKSSFPTQRGFFVLLRAQGRDRCFRAPSCTLELARALQGELASVHYPPTDLQPQTGTGPGNFRFLSPLRNSPPPRLRSRGNSTSLPCLLQFQGHSCIQTVFSIWLWMSTKQKRCPWRNLGERCVSKV